MGYSAFLKSLYPDSHNVNAEVYSAVLGAIGGVLDLYDPYSMGLPAEFSVTTATGTALDSNGADWGVTRRSGESDTVYRARILTMLPIYAMGDTTAGLIAMITPFTGVAPILLDLSADGWSWSDSAFSDSSFSDFASLFTLVIYIQNVPGSQADFDHMTDIDSLTDWDGENAYSHYDMEAATRQAKPARSRVIIYHNGVDTSSLEETPTAIITVV